ncbi:MAG: GNAT family N-acetyltransferase [Deltaproteobacteria bacterium]|nr:GNAT family N-acetyltransferase [Deltaproteobacteria bacterium]
MKSIAHDISSLPARFRDKQGRRITVQAFRTKDFDALVQMYDTFEPKGTECGLPPRDPGMRMAWLRDVTKELFNILAWNRGRVIGHCAIDLARKDSCPEYLIFLRQGFRNRGIGTFLCEVMKSVAGEVGCKKVVVTVRTANTRAVKVFQKVGFVFCGDIAAERDMQLLIKPGRSCRRCHEDERD